jgi:hypothetical protein
MLLRSSLRRTKNLQNSLKRCFSQQNQVQETVSSHLSDQIKTFQFSKENLVDFGELPRGEIPEALKYNPSFNHVSLNNGAQVGLEHYDSLHSGI